MSDENPTFGHVKISRKAYDSDPLWLERREFSRWEAWEDLIQFSAWGPRKLMVQDGVLSLERGEFLGSLRFLASRWAWTIKRVRTYVLFLIADERIAVAKEAQQGTVYVLVNYERYQGRGTPKGTDGAQQGHTGGTPRAQQGHKEEAVKQLSNEAIEELPTGVSLVRQTWSLPTIPQKYEDVTSRIATVFAEVQQSGQRSMEAEDVRQIQAEVVFAYWAAKLNHTTARLDGKRLARIKSRLAENGNDVNELLFVVDGAKRDEHIMGRTGGRKYDTVETIFRDRGQVERLAELGGFKPDAQHAMAKKYAALVAA